MINITVPAELIDSSDEVVILNWTYANGTVVRQGELIGELMIAKTQLELTAPASGRLTILAPADTVVAKHQVIGTIEPV